jgi:hypothetical protein
MCDKDDIMTIESRKLEKIDTFNTLEPYDFHTLQISSGNLTISCSSPFK